MRAPLVPHDLTRIAIAVDPQLAPDGRTVIYRRAAFNVANDKAGGALWRVLGDAPAAAFTSGTNDRLPRINPRGERIAFVRDVEEEARIHVMPLDGGEAQPVGEPCTGIASLEWSHDGNALAYTAPAPFDEMTAHVYFDEPSGARHIRALPYKGDLEGLHDGRRAQLFVLDLVAGTTRQLTHGDADAALPAWSPDGTTIAVLVGAAREASMINDIVLVDVADGSTRRLTAGDGPNGGASFSPDGRRIAWVGHRHGNDTRRSGELFVANVDGTERRSLSLALDRPIGVAVGGDLRSGGGAVPVWRGDDTLLALVSDRGNVSLRSFDLRDGTIATLAGGEREIYAFATAPQGAVVFAYSTPVIPSELARLDASGERTLTDTNPWLAEKRVIAPTHLPSPTADGTVLDAWLITPENPAAATPLVLEIHGGPHAAYGNTFFLEFQILAGCGLGVAYGNPRGSATYGTAFASAITADWGGIDANDVLAILDAALAAEPFDPARVAAVGGSYGGFMTTWLLGHCDRFATGISMRACNDFVSFNGVTDIGFFLEAELGTPLTADGMRELFERSPMRAVERITAPVLVMHSERDYRCPIDQGEQLFNVLRMLGKSDAEFVRLTGDGHELSRSGKPRHRVLRLRAIANWLRRQLGTVARSAGDDAAGSLFRPLAGEAALDPEPAAAT
jgi:dipeptidyl aminopeptidase/acylaminoacyl peptidase